MSALCRAVAIGDAHLGPNARQEQRLKALDTIIEAGLALRPSLGCWLWPGDIFHAKSTIADRNELALRLIRMANAAPVLGCRGNHDALGDLAIFESLATQWPIRFPERAEVLTELLPTGHVLSVFALPWPEEGGLVAAGVAPDDVPAAAREALNLLFMDAGRELDDRRAAGNLTAFIGHCTVVGAVSSNGQPQAGLGIEIDAELLARLGDCPKIVNHIHKGQTVAGAVYPGSICRLDFGEVEPKRFLHVEWSDVIATCGAETEGKNWTVFAERLDVAPMYHVDGWLSRDGFRFDEVEHGSGFPISWTGCEVRVRAKFHASEKAILEFAKAKLLAEFAEAARLQVELIAVPDGGLRAPEVAAAETLDDKVQAWAEATGTATSDLVSQRLVTLQATDGAELLDGLRRYMGSFLEVPESAGAAA